MHRRKKSVKIYWTTYFRDAESKRQTEIKDRIRKQFCKMLITSSSLRSLLECIRLKIRQLRELRDLENIR